MSGNNKLLIRRYHPHLRPLFDEFDGLVRIYHNDTPCAYLLESLAEANFDGFNFTHKVDIAEAKQKSAIGRL